MLQSQDVLLEQVELFLGHGQMPQVPEYPGDETEEDQQRSRQHEKVPKTQRCKDPDEEQEDADDVQNQSYDEEEDRVLHVCCGSARHDGPVNVLQRVWPE